MISGVHTVIDSDKPDEVRVFFRDVLEFDAVDSGDGWLIFSLPPSELGVHPSDVATSGRHEMFLMCDNLDETLTNLQSKGVECAEVTELQWGRLTSLRLPDGKALGLYEPRHARP